MPTRYDVFAEVIEKGPCKAKDLPFTVDIYNHLRALVVMGWVKESNKQYLPVKNNKTIHAFRIIKYCLKNGLDYNMFFSKNALPIVKALFASAPSLRPIKGNRDALEFLQYLEDNQFMLTAKKRPREGIVLRHQLFEDLHLLHGEKPNLKTTNYVHPFDDVKKIRETTNPFDESIFDYISGSASLEGSTITPGETRELILNDIYPDKPQKDIQMVKNLNEALQYVFEHLNEEITEADIKELNRIIMFSLHRHAGKYKITQNKIQGNPNFKTASPKSVPPLMEGYVKYLNEIQFREECLKELGRIHNEIQAIHPFADGNSRTTRMVVNWMLMKHEFPVLVIKMGCFDEYMSLSKLAKDRSDEHLGVLLQRLMLHESLLRRG
ncbi:MAG: Fic family protein [Candidatus Nanoarchaeia archaeon]